MGATFTPYGMYPRRCVGSRRCTQGGTAFPVVGDNALGPLFWGAPVHLGQNGTEVIVDAVLASPTTTASVNNPIGVMAGAQWEDGEGVHFGSWLPQNIKTAGGKRVIVTIMDDPDMVWMIQANGQLDMNAVGKSAALITPGAGNLNTIAHRSTCALNAATVAASATLAVRIIRVLEPGAPYPDCLVQWNTGIHQYQTNV